MEFIGIDFGSYKTTISSSKENGKIIGDEQGKRSIPTLLELTTPIRKFGNNITGEHEQTINLRFRNFRDDLTNENCQVYLMFLKYLDRIIKNNTKGAPSICISIPSYFKYSDKKFLLEISKLCNMKVERFYNDISAIGMFACLRREKIQEKFMIMDFGHTKTEIGIFNYINFKLTPTYLNNLKIGAKNFDEKLINLIIKKYKLEDKKIIREIIIRHLEKLKTILNSSETANTQIYFNETPVNIQITQEEYLVACKEDMEKIEKFLEIIKNETKFEGITEITGGNSSSFLIKKILEKKIEYQSTLDLTESCAIGTALGMACSILSNKFKLNDVIGRNINIKIEGNEKKTEIFKKTDLIETSKTLTYNRKNSFILEFTEDEEFIGKLIINKEDTEEAEPVKILLQINKLGLLEIKSCKIDEKNLEFKFETFEMSQEKKDELIKLEEKLRLLETNIEKIGHMRNELETMAMSLLDCMSGNLKDLFNNEDEEKVRNIAMDLFDIPSCNALEEEEEVRNNTIKQLSFVTEKFEKLEKNIREEIENMKNTINEYKERFSKKSNPSYFKLQGMFYKLEEIDKKMRLDLFNASSFDRTVFEKIKDDLKGCLVKAEEEIKKMEQEETKKGEDTNQDTKQNTKQHTKQNTKQDTKQDTKQHTEQDTKQGEEETK
ncbi:heat shock protein SSE1-like protein [Vairimorpha necatrix]|uniref:Heat shock protein SSE1-like protein n=1 Tax=Vairimorpha necatrix TaxID=6039 RepID=A0AAX4JG99_9MICR